MAPRHARAAVRTAPSGAARASPGTAATSSACTSPPPAHAEHWHKPPALRHAYRQQRGSANPCCVHVQHGRKLLRSLEFVTGSNDQGLAWLHASDKGWACLEASRGAVALHNALHGMQGQLLSVAVRHEPPARHARFHTAILASLLCTCPNDGCGMQAKLRE